MTITIYHNPQCGTSRNVLGLIRRTGPEPVVIEYLKTPPARDELVDLIARIGIPVRDLLRSSRCRVHTSAGSHDPPRATSHPLRVLR